jgi:hypothetical protein
MMKHDENVSPAYTQKDRIRDLRAMGSGARERGAQASD